MIIVEQSLNVAAAIADRAVFLEKGQVRFEGPIRDLMERDDLARAVFLGGHGGRRDAARSTWVNSQIVFDGIVQGLAIAVIAVGVVLVYRATRIINFAVGNMGVVGAAVLLVAGRPVPRAVLGRLAVALVIGLAFGAVVEWPSSAGLRNVAPGGRAGRHHRRVAGLAQAIAIKIPDSDRRQRHYPERHRRHLDGGRRHRARRRCRRADPRPDDAHRADLVPGPDRCIGRTVKACAINPRLGPLRPASAQDGLHHGVGVGAAAALDAVGRPHRRSESAAARDLATLGPQTLSLALVAAVIGRHASFRVAVVAAVVIGVLQSIVQLQLPRPARAHRTFCCS